MGLQEQYYHQVLGLTPGASPAELKAAYRRLVRQYHPDVNPAPDAREKFQEIAAAYEFLTHKSVADALFNEEQPHEDPLRIWRQKQKAERLRKELELARRRRELFKKIYRVLNYLIALYMLFLALLILDYLLPVTTHAEEVKSVERVYSHTKSSRTYRYDDVYFENFKLRVKKEALVTCCGEGLLYTTPILKTVLRAEIRQNGKQREVEPAYGFYHFFGILIPLALILGLVYYRLPQACERRLNVGLVVVFIWIFQLLLSVFLSR